MAHGTQPSTRKTQHSGLTTRSSTRSTPGCEPHGRAFVVCLFLRSGSAPVGVPSPGRATFSLRIKIAVRSGFPLQLNALRSRSSFFGTRGRISAVISGPQHGFRRNRACCARSRSIVFAGCRRDGFDCRLTKYRASGWCSTDTTEGRLPGESASLCRGLLG
jgi:hypothetical protein